MAAGISPSTEMMTLSIIPGSCVTLDETHCGQYDVTQGSARSAHEQGRHVRAEPVRRTSSVSSCTASRCLRLVRNIHSNRLAMVEVRASARSCTHQRGHHVECGGPEITHAFSVYVRRPGTQRANCPFGGRSLRRVVRDRPYTTAQAVPWPLAGLHTMPAGSWTRQTHSTELAGGPGRWLCNAPPAPRLGRAHGIGAGQQQPTPP